MSFTVEEAKTKWCPFARVSVDGLGGHSYNRSVAGFTPSKAACLADACMSWRWAKSVGSTAERGYCGLAGEG